MQTRLVAYDALGARRGVLPNSLETSITVSLNELSIMAVHYDRMSPKNELIDNQPEIAVEAFINDAWVELRNTRVKCLSVDFDHLEELPTRRYNFIGVGEGLKGVLVYGSYGLPLNDDGKVQFTQSNVGRILSTVWNNAVARGWSGFSYSFTPTHDSNGQPWAQTFSISYAFESNLLNILQNLVAQGSGDYEWEGRTLHVYNPNTKLARDLSLGANPIRFAGSGDHDGVDSAPEQQDVGNLATHVVALGEKGLRWEFPTGTIVPEGRREIVVTYSGVDDIGTVSLLVAPLLLKSQNHLKNTTRQWHLTPDTKVLPFLDYQVGDWANILRGTEFEKMRIFSLNMQINENGTQGYVILGDKIDDLLETMYQRIQGLTGGVANEGPGPIKMPPKRTPSAPYGVVVTPAAFIAADGTTKGIIGVNFSHNGKDTQGENISIRDYQVYYRPLGTSVWLHMMDVTPQSGSFSPIEVYDEFRNLMQYDLKVHARSAEGIISGPSATVAFTMVQDVTAPPTPTAPNVSTWLRTVTVRWDGMGKSPSNVTVNMPADYNVTNVWQASAPDMAGKVKVGSFTREVPMWQSNTMVAGQTVWYALSAVDWSGNESALSPSVSVTPVANVNLQEITDVVNGAMLGENSVNYVKLLASEQLWTRVLGAHFIKAGEIDVNSLTADAAWIGSLRTGILVSNSVITDTLAAGAITSKHTITGAVFQTDVSINTGIKISPALGFRAYDGSGNERIRITTTESTFTGKVTSGFGAAKTVLTDSVYNGRPGLQIVTGTGYHDEPFIISYDDTQTQPNLRGSIYASAAWINSTANPGRLLMAADGSFSLSGAHGSVATVGTGTQMTMQSGGSTVSAGLSSAYIQAPGGALFQANDNSTTSIVGTTTIFGALTVSGAKNFVMDHPTKPGLQLLHGSTESPVSGVEYWGSGTIDPGGTAVVGLPEYFDALVKPGTSHALVTGNGTIVSWTSIENGSFLVSGQPGTLFTWLVKAERFGGDFTPERIKEIPILGE